MASPLALDTVCEALLGVLRADSPFVTRLLNADGSLRLYPDANGDVPQRPVYPYASVESAGELPFNTLGGPDTKKWGSFVTIRVRIGSQHRSEREVRELTALAKAALDGQPLAVEGYALVTVEYQSLVPLEDLPGGVRTREWISEYAVTVHQ